MAPQHTPSNHWLRSGELQSIVPYSLNHIRRLEAAGSFPQRVRLGANRVAWVREEVEAWLNGARDWALRLVGTHCTPDAPELHKMQA